MHPAAAKPQAKPAAWLDDQQIVRANSGTGSKYDVPESWCDPNYAWMQRTPIDIDPPLTWDELIVGGIGIALMGAAVAFIVYKLAVVSLS